MEKQLYSWYQNLCYFSRVVLLNLPNAVTLQYKVPHVVTLTTMKLFGFYCLAVILLLV